MVAGQDAPELGPADRRRLAALRRSTSLADLVALTRAPDEHAAYFAAKDEWFDLRGRELAARKPDGGLPGNTVAVGDTRFHVHGITHADTPEEGSYLRTHVDRFVAEGAAVYCEQGVRSMYFADREAVGEMDDYQWAMAECERVEDRAGIADLSVTDDVDALNVDLDDLTGRIRETTFSLVDSGGEVYGESTRRALGDVASALLTGHEGLGTGEDFDSFIRSKRAARDPTALRDLQRYYERRFLPQPIEREWLRIHDPELEVVTHARNERMADYAVYHADGEADVHLVVGAAHQPGVTYYLERYRDGERDLDGFELVV